MATASFVTDLTEIVTQAVEAAAMVGSLFSSLAAVDQARDYYNLYNQQRQFYYNVFQKGAEAPLAAMVYTTAITNIDYAGTAKEVYGPTGPLKQQITSTLGWWNRHSLMYGASPSQPIVSEELQLDEIALESHWANMMYRYDESLVDLLNDQRWDHRMKLHNVALKQQSAVISGLSSAVDLREENMSATGSYLANVANSLAQRRGLIQGHKDAQSRYAEMASTSSNIFKAPTETARQPAQTWGLGSQPSSMPGHFENVN
jgi:hypothetical protein